MQRKIQLIGTTSARRSREELLLYDFVMDVLLRSRMATGLVSNAGTYDEDVNVYLAFLLCSLLNPNIVSLRARFTVLHDTDLADRISRTTDLRTCFNCYRSSADALLLMAGLFDHYPTDLDEEASLSRSSSYYRRAEAYGRQLQLKPSLPEILEKLSAATPKYRKILRYLAGEYFDLVDHFSPGDLFFFDQEVTDEHRQAVIAACWEAMFEAKAAVEADSSSTNATAYLEAIRRLKEVDSTFDSTKLSNPPAG